MKRRIIVHLVHGTWGRGFASVVREDIEGVSWLSRLYGILKPAAREPLWFEADSEFRRSVLEKVEAELRNNIEFREFLWSGSNSLRARQVAADDLRNHLQKNLSESPEACHLLVAHSHGGVVAFKAASRNWEPGSRQLDGIFSLGTPYLSVEEDLESDLKMLMFSLLPTAVGLFLLVLLIVLAAAHFYALAAWLGAMCFGLFIDRRVIPPNTDRPIIRIVADFLLAFSCAAAAWGAFSAVFSWIPLWHPPEAILGMWERGIRYPCGVFAACLSVFMLLAGRVAAVRGTRGEGFMLRDTVASIVLLGGPLVMGWAMIWAFSAQSASSAWFAVFLAFWPVAALLLRAKLSGAFSDPPRPESLSSAWIAVRNTLTEERGIPDLPCPLDALRLPGDEASLAIAAGLIAREVADLLTGAVQWFWQLKRIPRWLFWPSVALVVGTLATGVRSMYLGGVAGWLAYAGGAVLGLAAVCFSLLYGIGILLSGLFAFSLLTIALVAVAIGPELAGLLPALRVDCEPLPRCVPNDQCRFELQWIHSEMRSALPLRHFLHELEPVRERVSEWITARARIAAGEL